MFDCKGLNSSSGVPYVDRPKQVKILVDSRHIGNCWQYQIGTAAGKQMIMDALRVQQPGPRYCHFPDGEERGYNSRYFKGLLSEHLVYKKGRRNPWAWEIIPGHERNEPLDCRNYAQAALKALSPDMDAELRRRSGAPQKRTRQTASRRAVQKPRENRFDW